MDDAAIIAATLEAPPERLGVTHWSTRLLAHGIGVGDATVARAWRSARSDVPAGVRGQDDGSVAQELLDVLEG